MEKTFEQHRNELIRQALECWEDKGELKDIEKDPVIKILLSALAYQSHAVMKEIGAYKEMTVNEFRNKMIPYHLIKPFPAFSIVQTKIKENNKEQNDPLAVVQVDEKTGFEFGKNKIPFTPLLNTKIFNAEITNKQIDRDDNAIFLTLTSREVIDNFSGLSFLIEGAGTDFDIEISLDNQLLPLIKPDDYDNLPFTKWFQEHFLLAEENQLQFGNYDYWQELYLKNQIQMFYIDNYNSNEINNRNLSPVFKIKFKNLFNRESLRDCAIKINCVPVVNVQKNTVVLTDEEPVKKLSTDKSAFLNLLATETSVENRDNFIIRHYGIERYTQKELLFQLNDMFNRFISDYYAFKDIEELKKGEKLENLHKSFKDLLPVIKKQHFDDQPSVYAILKLEDKLIRKNNNIEIAFLNTHCELGNGIKKGEKPLSTSEFLDKENTFLLLETSGGRNEERNEENLNHLARYNLLTKDRILTASDIKAFCLKELKNKIKDVSVKNTGGQIVINIKLKNGVAQEQKEREYYESLIRQKINVRSLLSVPVKVVVSG